MSINVVNCETKEIHVVAEGQQGPPGAGGGVLIDDANPSLTTTFSGTHIMELLYPFSLSGLSISPSTSELGSTVTSVTLTWSTNYPPDTVSLDNGIGAITLPATSYVHSGQTITTPRTYTISAVRNGVTKTAQATTSFLNQVYWGVEVTQTTAPATIVTWNKQLSGSRSRSITYDCSGGRYFHLAYPKRLGVATFKINNLTYSDVTQSEVSVTNASGYSELYYVYYCNVIQFGSSITLVVQ